MTTITWADFPKIEDSKKGRKVGYEFEDFLHSNYARDNGRVRRITQNVINIGAITGIFLIGTEIEVSAALGLDDKVKKLFDQFLWIAKWIIALKGGVSVLSKALNENFEGAKKDAIQYLLIYGMLIALPKGLDLVEALFEGY